ncbi:MAG: helix-turn-helix domain-containing protein [Oscillospiraceae bacterium]|jgi:transcriptional regulator with XRE-family HTH domain|nr:helix-turn-helix domain-containing protein [Oscillospiraceae bacterium]
MILQDINIGEIFRQLRLSQNLSQSQVCTRAQLLGSKMSRSTYSQIELGRRNIKASDFVVLRHVFQTSYEFLLGDTVPLNSVD